MRKNKAIESPRHVAIRSLYEFYKDQIAVKAVLDQRLPQLSEKDRQLSKNIVYGVLRQKGYLDHLLGELCHQPIKKMKPLVYWGLCCGLYQIFFLDRIPDSAAVNETIKALRAEHLPSKLTGFVNGVLRASIRQKDSLPAPASPQKANDILNHPQWLTTKWAKAYGTEKMIQICINNATTPLLSLRVNLKKTSVDELLEQLLAADIQAQPGLYSQQSIVIPSFHGSITNIPGYHEGLFQIQDQAAQLASLLLGPIEPGHKVLDCCAGLGGKTTHILELAATDSVIDALEPDEKRFTLLQESISRASEPSQFNCYNKSIEQFKNTNQVRYDKILIDAPCSGTGVIGRQPDIRWNRKEGDLKKYATTQLMLLKETIPLLKPGGIIVYATCSIEEEENRGVINTFLTDHPQFQMEDCGPYLKGQAREHIVEKCFNPIPSAEIDGFFAARLILNHG